MWIEVKGRKIYYEVAGEGEPVLFLHGIPTAGHLWRHQMAALAPRFRVYAPDLLGWARSDKPDDFDYSVGAYAEFVDDLLAALEITQPIVLVVHDLGGAIGLEFVARYPEKVARLAILDTFAYLPTSKRLPWVLAYRFVRRLPLIGDSLWHAGYELGVQHTDLFVRIAFHDPHRMSRALVETYREFNRDTEKTDTRVLLRNGIDGITGAVERNARRVRVPTLILWAEGDLLFPPSAAFRLQRDIPGSVLRVVPECGHFLQEEKPDAVNAALLAFLTGSAMPYDAIGAEVPTAHAHGRSLQHLLGALLTLAGARAALRGKGVRARSLGLLAALTGVGLWRSVGARTQTVAVSVTLDASLEAVWPEMSEMRFLATMPFTTMTIARAPGGVGTTYRWTFALPLGPRFEFGEVVTEWVERERIAYRATSGWEMEASAVLVPIARGTRVDFTLRYRAPGLWSLVPVSLVRAACGRALARLPGFIASPTTARHEAVVMEG